MPVYNVEKYIDECIQSIVSQTFKDIEIILVDDGSTDSSSLLCDQWAQKDERINVIHKKNTGVSDTRNNGIDRAKGKYILFLDADDYCYEPTALKLLVQTAEKHNLDIVRGEYKAVDEKGKDLFIRSINKKKQKISYKVIDSGTFYTDAMGGENFLVLSLFKKDAVGNLRLNTNRSFLEDAEFYTKLLLKPLRCMYIPLRFYAYRKISSSASNTPKIKNLSDSFEMCNIFHECALQARDENLRKSYQYNSIMMYYWTLETLSSAPYYAKHPSIIKELSLCERQKQVAEWARKDRRHYPFYTYMNPNIGTKILRIELLIKGTILKYGSKCKRTIYKWIKK